MADDNEAEAPAADSKAGDKAGEKAGGNSRNKTLLTGAAIGIGSAALVAALLYANRARRSERS